MKMNEHTYARTNEMKTIPQRTNERTHVHAHGRMKTDNDFNTGIFFIFKKERKRKKEIGKERTYETFF